MSLEHPTHRDVIVAHAAAGRLRDLVDTVHDVSSAASRRLLDLAKAQVAARAGVIDILINDEPSAAEEATMAEVSAQSPPDAGRSRR